MGRKAIGSGAKRAISLLTASAILAAMLAFFCMPALAAGGIQMSTPYPGQSVKAGSNAAIDLTLANGTDSGCTANLSVVSMPDGWSGYFSGNSAQITQAYIDAGKTASATFNAAVPSDAKEGTYKVVLKAETSDGLTSTLPLELTVSQQQAGSSTFTVEYPSQEGSASASFSFSATLANQSLASQSYSLSAEYPSGWSVTFAAASSATQVAAISVDAKQSQGLSVTVKPAQDVTAGDYKITLVATSASETLKSELSVTISETYSLSMTTQSGILSLDAHANKASPITLEITNSSNVALQNVNLTSSAPDGWTVTFSSSTLDKIEAGATVEVTAYVTPSKDAMSGDYSATISAKTSQASASADFRITVKTETVWGIVGVVLIVVMVGGIYLVFRKYGRR
jgi:uncharacterized membrane protein